MTRKDKAARIQKVLSDLYPLPPVPLHHRDPYTLLIAVLLSARCTDVRVNQVAPFRPGGDAPGHGPPRRPSDRDDHPTLRARPRQAKHIRGLSRILVERHAGQVPASFEALEALPGVGHKTASVVMAQAFGQPAFPVDTHIHRLAARWGLSSGQSVEATERDLKRLYPPAAWSTLHLQIIYFGREHCPARSHAFDECPICSWAASRRHVVRERARRSAPRRSTPAGARRR